MKKLILLFAFAAILGTASAQKERMLIDYFTFSNKNDITRVNPVRNQVITGLNATGRLVFIDVDTEQTLKIEEERRSSEGAMGDQTARIGEMKKLGANYLLSGNVDNITIEKKTTDDNKVFYNATVGFTLKVTNVEDGSLLTSETFQALGGGSLFGSGSTSEKALDGAINLVGDKMRKFVDVTFPLTGTIAEMKAEKKGKMVACYVNLGSDHGIAPGQYLTVFKIQSIAGRSSKIEAGTLKIEAVVAGDLSDCKVTKGGDVILTSFQNGDELIVETIARKGLGGLLD